MAFDFKKEYREFYMPGNQPEIVTVPRAGYIAVRGSGDPNQEGGDYQRAVGVLYAVAYTIKMSYKGSRRIEGFFEYVVPPLEGFWWQPGHAGVDFSDKASFQWLSVIRVPGFVGEADVAWARRMAAERKGLDCSAVELLRIDEGLCMQCMHRGPYDDEPATVRAMREFAAENGLAEDFSDKRHHHEIYLSDPRRTAPEKLKTVIRHPVRTL